MTIWTTSTTMSGLKRRGQIQCSDSSTTPCDLKLQANQVKEDSMALVRSLNRTAFCSKIQMIWTMCLMAWDLHKSRIL